MKKLLFAAAILSVALSASADMMDRSGGFRIGKRFLLRPYISFSYTYDSNVDSTHNRTGANSFSVNPGFNLLYRGDQFELNAAAWYSYYAYTQYSSSLNNHTFGENVAFHWHDGATAESDAWDFMITESYSRLSQSDDMMNDGGRGISRDRDQITLNAALMRNFTEKFHASVYGGYYWLKYLNDASSYGPMYGWDRWSAGGEIGYRLSKWSDFFVTGNYQGYRQDNASNCEGYLPATASGRNYGSHSDGLTVHGGIGSAFTERISYRVAGGWSAFKYADARTANGFSYDVNGRWKMTDNWQMMLLAGSYYQPSEYLYGSLTRNDTISWGLAHSMVRGKLIASLDLAYRHEAQSYSDDVGYGDYTADVLTGRIGLDYTLCRFMAVFGRAEYQKRFAHGGYADHQDWDYDRWRLTVGFRFQY